MSGAVYTRRQMLALVGGALVGAIGCHRHSSVEESESVIVTALRRAAQGPGPARLRLPAVDQFPGRPIYQIPFPLDRVPGFSRDTHFVHYERHYLEYYCRWIEAESRLLKQIATIPPGDQEALRRSQSAVIAESFALRGAANMVILHEAYWDRLWSGETPRDPVVFAELHGQLAAVTPRPPAAWIVAASDRHLWHVDPLGELPDGLEPLAAIDCPEHAWALDFADYGTYLAGMLANMRKDAFDSLAAVSLHPRNSAFATPAERAEAAPLVARLCDLHGIAKVESVIGGLAELADAGLHVRILRRIATGAPTLQICPSGLPSGLWGHSGAGDF